MHEDRRRIELLNLTLPPTGAAAQRAWHDELGLKVGRLIEDLKRAYQVPRRD